MGTDLDIVLIDANSLEEYATDSELIPRNSSVLVRRVPGNRRRRSIDTSPIVADPPVVKHLPIDLTSRSASQSSGVTTAVDDDDDWDYDVYSCPGTMQSPAIKPTCADRSTEDRKIEALVSPSPYLATNPCSRSGAERIPPDGYVCRRCNTPGHYIQHCTTNSVPKYGIGRQQAHSNISIPKSVHMVNHNDTHKLHGGGAAVLKPNDDAFVKEMEGLSSSSSNSTSIRSIPPELHCPLCRLVMKEAVLTSKCCFDSFCDKCIRDHLVNSKQNCVCGKSEILTDYLIPNVTLRETINRILGTKTCSSGGESASSVFQAQIKETTSVQLRSAPIAKRSEGLTDASVAEINAGKSTPHSRETEYDGKNKKRKMDEFQDEDSMGYYGTKSGEASQGKKRREMVKVRRNEDCMTSMDSFNPYAYGIHPWMPGYVTNTMPYNSYAMEPYYGYMVPKNF